MISNFGEFQTKFKQISSKDELKVFVKELQVLSYNYRGNSIVFDIVKRTILKSLSLDDTTSLINLHSLEITHLQHKKKNLEIITEISEKIRTLSERYQYKDGLALYYAHKWYIAKSKENKHQATEAIEQSIRILSDFPTNDDFIFNVCNYIYAVEKWLELREIESAKILENCFNYFSTNGFFHGSAMSLGILAIIFQQTQNKKDSMKLLERNIYCTDVLSKMPTEIQSIIHFFIGFSHGLNFNLKEAEKHLTEAQNILKTIYRKSIYSGYYLITLSQLTAIYALQGKIDLAYEQMKEVEELMEEGIAIKYLDSFNRKQITHTFNLVTFYIKSRQHSFQTEDLQELVQTIVEDIDKYYSNAMFFSEFLLNSDLSKEQLIEIRNSNNQSTKRIEHVINFLIEKTAKTDEQQTMKSILILKERPEKEKMTSLIYNLPSF